MGQQPALDIERGVIRTMHEPAQPGLAHYAMAGNDNGNGILTAGLADCARAGTEPHSQFAVGLRLSAWNGLHGLPHFALVLSTIQLERQIEAGIRISEIGFELRADLICQCTARSLCPRVRRKEIDAQQHLIRAADAEPSERNCENRLIVHADMITEMKAPASVQAHTGAAA